MCVKILRENQEVSFDPDKEFMPQVEGATKVVVNYKPKDREVASFIECMEQCVKLGIDPKVKLQVNYEDQIAGTKVKRKLKKALSDISINEVVKLVAMSQQSIDKKLEEISEMCLKENNAK